MRFLHNSVRFLDNCLFCGKTVIGIKWRTLFGRLAGLTNLGGALNSYGRNWPMYWPISDGCADPWGPIGSGSLPAGSGMCHRHPTHRIHDRLAGGAISCARCVEAKDLYNHLEGTHDPAA